MNQRLKLILMFAAIMLIGGIARIWQFGQVPSGINPDEASIGIDAYYLLRYGMDRYGLSYPVHLISWSSGQNALYAYLLMPVILLNGLNAVSIRLPMLIAGILTMPLVYLAAKRMVDEKFGLLAMFFVAISPWHIINARWAVESNIFPFVFLCGFVLFLFSNTTNKLFIAACVFFAVGLYAYGTAYAAVPVFLLFGMWVYRKKITVWQGLTGLGFFGLIALPIFVFILLNTLRLETLHVGPITIPRLPVEARYESLGALFGESPLSVAGENLKVMWSLLWGQADDSARHHVEPYGYFYTITFPFALLGCAAAFLAARKKQADADSFGLLFVWLCAALVIGLIHPVNLIRLNLIFTPLIIYIAYFVFEAGKRVPFLLHGVIVALLIAFLMFQQSYYGVEHQRRLKVAYNSGILQAIEYAMDKNNGEPVCLTETIPSGYVYVLYTQKPSPLDLEKGLSQVEWLYPSDYPINPARFPRTLLQFHFQMSDCVKNPEAAYILLLGEQPPNAEINYRLRKFDRFQVYIPKD